MKTKKLYLVRREVMATSITDAMKAKGVIYSIELASEKEQPEIKGPLGFKKNV